MECSSLLTRITISFIAVVVGCSMHAVKKVGLGPTNDVRSVIVSDVDPATYNKASGIIRIF